MDKLSDWEAPQEIKHFKEIKRKLLFYNTCNKYATYISYNVSLFHYL